MARDLDRWSGDAGAPAELRELLGSARGDLPSAHQLSGLESKLGALFDAPPPAAQPPADATPRPTVTSPGMPGLAKLAVIVAVGGLVGSGVYFGTREPTPAPSPSPVSAPAPKAAPLPEQPVAEAAPAAPASEAPVADAAPPKAPAQAASKPSEASLLNQAQQALKTNPRRALQLTRLHKQLYPQGSLSQEREVIAIEALSRLDKKSSAQERADAFSEKYPESAHQKKVDTSLKE